MAQRKSAPADVDPALCAALIDRIVAIANVPQRSGSFEHLGTDLLLAMGYGGGRKDAAIRLGRSGDGGVDAVIRLDPLGLDLLYLQAKCYKPDHLVDVATVRDFSGSLDAKKMSRGVPRRTNVGWIEPVLLEHEFPIGAGQKTIRARLGFPRSIEDGREWACSFQITGWKNSKIRVAHGVDALQALLNAAAAIRKSLDSVKGIHSGNEPYEFVFPRVIPVSYGLEFHRHLCNILDEEISKKEQQLSRKRLSRKKRS
jgi:hypothetical protein